MLHLIIKKKVFELKKRLFSDFWCVILVRNKPLEQQAHRDKTSSDEEAMMEQRDR